MSDGPDTGGLGSGAERDPGSGTESAPDPGFAREPSPEVDPNTAVDAATAPLRRLPPISLLFNLVGGLRNLLGLVIFAIFFSNSSYELWLLVAAIPILGGVFLRYATFSYRLGDEEMVIREGVITRNERHVPYHRIQNIDLVRNPFHRWFDVAVVRIETASGGKPEAVISVLGLDAVAEMRHRVFADSSTELAAGGSPADDSASGTSGDTASALLLEASDGAAPRRVQAAPAGRVLLEVPSGDLVKLGLISNRGMLVIGAALGALSQSGIADRYVFGSGETALNDLGDRYVFRNRARRPGSGAESAVEDAAVGDAVESEPLSARPDVGDRIEAWVESFRRPGAEAGDGAGSFDILPWDALLQAGLWIVGGLLLLLALTRLLSVPWTLYKLYGFRLSQHGEDLRTRSGLVTQVSATVPRHRVQLLSAKLTPGHRWVDRVSVQSETAGGGDAASGDSGDGARAGQAERLWLAPMVPRADLSQLVREVLPEVDLDRVVWHPVSARARRRLFRRMVYRVAFLGTLAFAVPLVRWWALVLLLALPLAWLWATRWARNSGWALSDQAVLWRSGAFTRQISMVPIGKIQAVDQISTFWDRRAGMASLRVDTAGANLGRHRVSMRWLDGDDAGQLAETLLHRAEATDFRW